MRIAWLLIALSGCGHLSFERSSQEQGEPENPGTPENPGEVTGALVVSIAEDRMAGAPTLSAVRELPSGTVGLSLREAIAIANNHSGVDVIRFDPGVFSKATAIAIDEPFVVSGADTTIDASTASVSIIAATGYTGDFFHVTGVNQVIDGLAVSGGGGAVVATSVAGLVLRRLTIVDTAREAIRIESVSQGVVERCRIENTVGDPVAVRSSNDVQVRGNTISLRTKEGSVHGVYFEQVFNSAIVDNVIDPGEAFLINLTDSSNNEISGNILDRGDTGLTVFGNSVNNAIVRNVVISPNADSIYIDTPALNNTVAHNTFFRASDVVDSGMTTKCANNLVTDDAAAFVDPAGYDFHLVAGMTAIDGAEDLGLDLLPDRPERYLGAAPDLGAVESF